MGDFLCEAIMDCNSIPMLRSALQHIKEKIEELESANDYINEFDCNECLYSKVDYDYDRCKDCKNSKNMCNFSGTY